MKAEEQANKIHEAALVYRKEMRRKMRLKDYKHMSTEIVARSTAFKICKEFGIDLKQFEKIMI